MKLLALFGLLLVQSVFAVPTSETAPVERLAELKDDTEATDPVDTQTTLFLTEENDGVTHDRHERSACVETEEGGLLCKRNYGGHGHGGGLAGFVYGGHSAGTYIGRNEPCAKRSYKPEPKSHGYGHGGHSGHGYGHKGHSAHSHGGHSGHGYEQKGHSGHGYEQKGHSGHGYEHKGHSGHGYEHKGHSGYEHKGHSGYEQKDHSGYGHGHGGHSEHGYGHGGHSGYGHGGHSGHGYTHGHSSYGHGHGHGQSHGYKSSFEQAEQAEQFDAQADFVASPQYGHVSEHHAGSYVQPVHHQVHSYAAHSPKVECGSNLLVGCNVHTAKAPCVPSYHGGYGHHAAPAHHGHYEAPAHHEAKYKSKQAGFRADDENKEQPKEGENRSEPNSLHLDPSTNVSNGQTNNNQQHPSSQGSQGSQASDASKRDETIAAMKKIMNKVKNKEQGSNV